MSSIVGRRYVCLFTAILLVAGCGRTKDTETPVVTPTVTLARPDAAIGMPVEMSYRFVVAGITIVLLATSVI